VPIPWARGQGLFCRKAHRRKAAPFASHALAVVRGRFCLCCRRSQLTGYAAPSPWPVPSSPYRGRQGDGEWLQAMGLSSYGGCDTALPSCFPRFCFILGRF
jgi:hypothetical protein